MAAVTYYFTITAKIFLKDKYDFRFSIVKPPH